MPVLVLIIGLVVLVWGLFALKLSWARLRNLSLFPIVGSLIVILGSVLGREFFAVNVGPIPLTLDRVILAGLGCTFVYFVLAGRMRVDRFNATDYGIFAVTAVLTVSTFMHDYSALEKLPLTRLIFFQWLPASVYFLMRNSNVGVRSLNICAILFLVFSIYLAATAIAEWKYQYWAVFPKYIINSETIEFLGRGRGPFLNPVSNGLYMIVGFTLLGMMFQQSKRMRLKCILIGLACFLACGVFATLTRSVWLSLGLVGLVLVGVTFGRKGSGAILVAAGMGLVLLFGATGSLLEFKRDKNVSAHEMKQSAALRPLFAIVAFRMFEDRPVLGCGYGQYNIAKQPYLHDPTSKYPLQLTQPYMQHNIFLAYLAETGLAGLFFLLFLLTQATRDGCALWRDKNRAPTERQLGLTLCLCLLAFVVNGMFHDVSIAPQLLLQIYFLLGLTVAVRCGDSTLADKDENETKNSEVPEHFGVAVRPSSSRAA